MLAATCTASFLVGLIGARVATLWFRRRHNRQARIERRFSSIRERGADE